MLSTKPEIHNVSQHGQCRCDMRTFMCLRSVRASRVKDRTRWCNKGRRRALRTLAYVCIIWSPDRTHHLVCPQPDDKY